ncbi:MAG: adenosylmethionine--8-amino-7-oxononanoate transaminase, partial [Fibrobacterota bacterium]
MSKTDLQYIWHPLTQMKEHEEFAPLKISKGKGIYLYDDEGKKYIDAISSWWVNILGHCNPEINKKIKEQLDLLEHVIFAGLTHEPAEQLAEKLIEITHDKLKKVFFADNGSSAVDAALKLSYQYHQQTGNTQKKKFVFLKDGYHGETIGALSMGGCDLYKKRYRHLLIKGHMAEGPECAACPYELDRKTCDAECFEKMEKLLREHHEECCGVIIEPMVQAAGGMKIYSPAYLKKLRNLCYELNVHLIADEIAVGFGRTGKMFGCDHAAICPDIMTLSKGLSGGYLPISVFLTTSEIYEAFYDDYSSGKTFMHSHSYCGNPLGCAAGIAAINLLQKGKYIETAPLKEEYIYSSAEKLENLPYVNNFRNIGTIAAFDTDPDFYDEKKGRFAWTFFRKALENGAL